MSRPKPILAALFLMALLSAPARAEVDVKQEISNVLDGIRAELWNTQLGTPALAKIRDELAGIRQQLKDGSVIPQPGDVRLFCTARDNDNTNPYVLAYRNPIDLKEARIAGTTMTRAQCDLSSQTGRSLERTLFVCAPRDNDSANPFSVLAYSLESKTAQKLGVYPAHDACLQALNASFAGFQNFLICASRDNDGQAPWIKLNYDVRTASVSKEPSTYASLQECVQSNR